jgi:D-alanine-D-alanine ligase-like ATP-grasp enzyme
MHTGNYLLLLGATMALRERALVAALRVFPGPVVTIAPSPQTRAGKLFDHVLRGVISDPASALGAVRAFEDETGRRPAAVVPLLDGVLYAGLAIAEHYGVPYLTRDAVDTSSINKDLMKDRLHAAGLPSPRYERVDGLGAVHAAIDRFGLPCVIKPSAFGGSLGVRLIRDRAEAAEAFEYVRAIIERTAPTFTVKNRAVQVEELCTLTDEVSVEVQTHPGREAVLAVVDKSLGEPPFFAEIGHRVPSRYSGRQDVRELALAACAALGLDRGLAHVEIRLEDGAAPVVIEVGSRTAGDGILDLVERVYGFSPYELHLRSYLDLWDGPAPDAAPAPTPAGVAAIAMLKAPPGRIDAVATPSDMDPAVVGYEVSATPGTVSSPVSANYLDREGYVECWWPGADPGSVPAGEHLDIAARLSAQLFPTD